MAGSAGSGFVEIHFELGGKRIDRAFAQWSANIRDMSPAWNQVGQYLRDQFAKNYAQEGGWVGAGTSWPQLRPSTVADRIRKGFPGEHPILVRQGTLRDSLLQIGGYGNVYEVRPDGLTYGTTIPYAQYHQYGAPRANIPPRPLIGLTWYSKQDIVRILGDWVREEAAKAFGSAGSF